MRNEMVIERMSSSQHWRLGDPVHTQDREGHRDSTSWGSWWMVLACAATAAAIFLWG